MSLTFTAIGHLAQAPRGKSFILAGHFTDNIFGRVQTVPFRLNLVLTKDNDGALEGAIPGAALMVEGRAIGLPGTGGLLLLAPLVIPLGALPGTLIEHQHYAACGVNAAHFAGNVTTQPVIEEFRGGALRVTLSAEFNTRRDAVKIVSMGQSAAALRDLKQGDRLTFSGHVASENTFDPNGREINEIHLQTGRIDTEAAADYAARTTRPRKGKMNQDRTHLAKEQPGSKQDAARKNAAAEPGNGTRKSVPSKGVPKREKPAVQNPPTPDPQSAATAPARPVTPAAIPPVPATAAPQAASPAGTPSAFVASPTATPEVAGARAGARLSVDTLSQAE